MITAPFVTANVLQILWCASFLPKYVMGQWGALVSPSMMAGTAIALSDIHGDLQAASSSSYLLLYSLPLTPHFVWMKAAALTNLSGAVSSDLSNPDRLVVSFGTWRRCLQPHWGPL